MPIEDEVNAAAVNVERNRGCFALLIGSGTSRGAVKTGYEILIDLIQQLRTGSTSNSELGDEEWFASTYSLEPTYSNVLERISASPETRIGLLSEYFTRSPSPDGGDPQQPRDTHLAVADLMHAGIIKICVTTNFDRLIERALNLRGIEPTVIATAEQFRSHRPLHAESHCVIKLNGDFTDPNFLNTLDELSHYPPEVATLLGKVLNDYGLIVCGWSANWDVALRNTIISNGTPPFGSYWINPSEPDDEARSVIEALGANVIKATSDQFFGGLVEHLRGSVAAANVASLRASSVFSEFARLASTHDWQLDRKFSEEIRRTRALVDSSDWDFASTSIEYGQALLNQLDSDTIDAASAVTAIAAIGDAAAFGTVLPFLKEMALRPTRTGRVSRLIEDLQQYPASKLMYAAGVALVLKNRFSELRSLLTLEIGSPYRSDTHPISDELVAAAVLSVELFSTSKGLPQSEHVYQELKHIFTREIGCADAAYTEAFDEFEYLLFLNSADAGLRRKYGYQATLGRVQYGPRPSIPSAHERSLESITSRQHPYLDAGFFGGDFDRMLVALYEYAQRLSSMPYMIASKTFSNQF